MYYITIISHIQQYNTTKTRRWRRKKRGRGKGIRMVKKHKNTRKILGLNKNLFIKKNQNAIQNE